MKRLLLLCLLLLSSVASAQEFTVSQQTPTYNTNPQFELNLGDDSVTTVMLPFSFTLYDKQFESAKIYNNGIISFNTSMLPGNGCCSGLDLSKLNDPAYNYTLFPLWVDLISLTAQYKNPYFNAFTDKVIISWYNIKEYGTSNQNTFQVQLYDTGKFDFIYSNVNIARHGVTIGYTGDITKGEYQQYYTGYGVNLKDVSLSVNPTKDKEIECNLFPDEPKCRDMKPDFNNIAMTPPPESFIGGYNYSIVNTPTPTQIQETVDKNEIISTVQEKNKEYRLDPMNPLESNKQVIQNDFQIKTGDQLVGKLIQMPEFISQEIIQGSQSIGIDIGGSTDQAKEIVSVTNLSDSMPSANFSSSLTSPTSFNSMAMNIGNQQPQQSKQNQEEKKKDQPPPNTNINLKDNYFGNAQQQAVNAIGFNPGYGQYVAMQLPDGAQWYKTEQIYKNNKLEYKPNRAFFSGNDVMMNELVMQQYRKE